MGPRRLRGPLDVSTMEAGTRAQKVTQSPRCSLGGGAISRVRRVLRAHLLRQLVQLEALERRDALAIGAEDAALALCDAQRLERVAASRASTTSELCSQCGTFTGMRDLA